MVDDTREYDEPGVEAAETYSYYLVCVGNVDEHNLRVLDWDKSAVVAALICKNYVDSGHDAYLMGVDRLPMSADSEHDNIFVIEVGTHFVGFILSHHVWAVMKDGGELCHQCLTNRTNPVHVGDQADPQWQIGYLDIERTSVTVCAHCYVEAV